MATCRRRPAADALSSACDTPTLRRLAGETGPLTRADLDDDVLRCFRELGLLTPGPGHARAFLVNQWAALWPNGRSSPTRGRSASGISATSGGASRSGIASASSSA